MAGAALAAGRRNNRANSSARRGKLRDLNVRFQFQCLAHLAYDNERGLSLPSPAEHLRGRARKLPRNFCALVQVFQLGLGRCLPQCAHTFAQFVCEGRPDPR